MSHRARAGHADNERPREREEGQRESESDHESEAVDEPENSEEDGEGEDEEEMDDDASSASSSMASPRTHRESLTLDGDEFEDPVEASVFHLVQDVVTADWADEELTAKLNMIAEALEEAEATFRKDRTPPYRREGNLIGALLHVLEQHEDFYPMLESKLSELTDARVKAAVCRVLLATVPVNSRFIVQFLCEEETLDRICDYAAEGESPLRCYATGLLAVGLRDRSIADIVVNKDASVQFLKRVRLYASKLEKERQQATKYIHDHLKTAARGRRTVVSSSTSSRPATSGVSGTAPSSSHAATAGQPTVHRTTGSKRKYSESGMRTASHDRTATESEGDLAHQSTQDDQEEDSIGSVETLSSSQTIHPVLPVESEEALAANPHVETDLLGFQPDPERHEEDLKRLVMLELLYTLDCIGLMGEYMELFAPALKEDIIGTIVTFLHNKNPTVLSHTMKVTSHFLAHKKFALSLIDAGGIDLIFATAKALQGSGQIGLLDRSLSMCLHGLASSNAVMEKALSVDAESLLTVSFTLLSSANDRARQNAVVFFGLTLCFKVVLEYFEKENGLYTLLNIIRAGNNPKSAVQRQLSHDACLCLRQYLRVHMALATHRLRRRLAQLNHPSNRSTMGTPVLTAAPALVRLPVRVPKLHASKAVDIDDKAHEQNLVFYEKYQFSVPSGSNGSSGAPWSATSGPGGTMWPPAAKLSHLRGPLVMLEVIAMVAALIQSGDPDDTSNAIRVWIVERAQFCLECLRVLTLVVPSLASEVCSTEVVVDENGMLKRAGMSILLEISMSTNARDSDLVRDALFVFCNCVSPPHSEDCWQHPHKDIRQYTLTARDMRMQQQQSLSHGFANGSGGGIQQVLEEDHGVTVCCSRVRDDKALRPVRKLAREKNAIKVCVQLLRYKRSVQNADAIRLLATRALLGLSRDRHIAQILEKMQLGQLLSDLIRQDPVLEENADLHVRFRESALDLISLVTHRAPNAVINEATDPTVRKIEKASIVAQTPITYDPNELLKLIHDHLKAKGLNESAAALVRECQLNGEEENATRRELMTTTYKTPEKLRVSDKRSAAVGHQCDVATSMKALYGETKDSSDDKPRAAKIPRLVLQASSSSEPPDHAILTRVSSDPGATATRVAQVSTVRLPHGERRKRIRQAFATPHLFASPELRPRLKKASSDPPITSKSGPQRHSTGSGTVGPVLPSINRRTASSRLDDIITHYLREQHRQCANPVTTVPPFKLIGDDAFHRCPDPSTLAKTPINICSRLMERSRTSFRQGARAFTSPYADAGVNRYVFSRYRPYRVVGNHASSQWGVSVARFYGDDQRELLMGNHDGQLRRIQIDSDQVVEEWTCHSSMSAIVDLETNDSTRMARAQNPNRLILTGATAVTAYGTSEVALWDVNAMNTARWRLTGALSPRFNHYGDRIVALDARLDSEDDNDQLMDGDHASVSGALVVDVATGSVVCELKDGVQSNDYKRDTNCCFAQDDSTILTGGMLWDARIPTRALYKFDKLSNFGYGFFHPNGNEVIINSAVWDLRTCQLLRMVPALDKCTVRFNATGAVMFAYSPHSVVESMERRRSKAKTWFRVLDPRDYKDISTIELQRPIYDLSVDSNSTLLSVVEGLYLDADSSSDDDPVCRLYEIGRNRPREDDSDVEDALGGSDMMDDDEFDDESDEDEEDDEDQEDDDDEDDDEEEDEEEDEYEYDHDEEDEEDGIEYVGSDEEEEEEDLDESQDGGSEDGGEDAPRFSRGRARGSGGGGAPMSVRDIQMLFELPEGTYYEDYSSDDEDE